MSVDLPIKDARFFQNVAEIDVCVEEVRVQRDSFFKMVNGQPNFALSIEDAAQVGPGNSKIWSRFDCLQIASLKGGGSRGIEVQQRVQVGGEVNWISEINPVSVSAGNQVIYE